MGAGRGLRDSVARSVTLLRVFLIASAAILVTGAIALGGMLTRAIDRQAVDDERAGIVQYVGSVVTPGLVRDNHIRMTRAAAATLERGMRIRGDLLSVKVWRRDGLLLWTTLDTRRIGKHFTLSDDLQETLKTGEAHGAVEDLSEAPPGSEETAERLTGIRRALEVYAPIRGADGRLLGAYEVYGQTDHLDAIASANIRTIWLTVAGVFAALLILLTLLVRGASGRLHRQTEALRHSYRMLEESSLETIETLNATVEAKDPYTAGHSQRVQGIALAIGRELDLSRDELENLGASALFHDVGKIGVPDAILTKPGKLDAAEFETIKQHAARGAEIVSKLSHLKDAVPAIRHHHERWDGHGYPDGLVGGQIPLEASIVGLADAWDAMTTERPYARALPLTSALEQVRAGRGTQFRPDVVDAFLAVATNLPGSQPSSPVRSLRPVAAAG
jgi:HD-GYP domain-containing protein (c-di-GMP phosphodiesterase class II)